MQKCLNKFAQFLLVLMLSGCAGGLTSFNKAQKLEQDGKLDEAVLKYAEAASKDPESNEYRVRLMKVSEAAARIHFAKGEEFFSQQKYDDALREYQSALALDASIARAKQQSELLVRYKNSQVYYNEGDQFERNNKPREALQSYRKSLDQNPKNAEAKSALERLLKNKQTRLEGYDLNLKSTKPITLKFKDAKTKDVFYILSQLSGINFIFDDGVKDQNITIFLENATFQQSLDILTGMNKLGRKVLNESTIVIFQKTPEKAKQYEDLMVKTFFLNTLDAKKAVNLLRTMLQVRKVYVNEELNAIVIRDTPDVIDVAQKIIEANDVPDAEVLLEVEVIEISSTNEENFGLGLSRYAVSLNTETPSGGFLSDTFNAATTTTTTGTAVTTAATQPNSLLQVMSWKGFGGFLTVPSATYNFSKRISNAEVLANPRIRVKNREKSKFTVGTRVPITTTSTTGSGTGINVNVQYVDVGVKVNAEPTIQLNNEVTIKLSMEVSSITDREKIGSDQVTTVVTIGTRNLDTVLNLKDGETSIVGGLIQDSKTKGKNKIFLLGDIPFIGPLLTNTTNSKNKSELVLAITPRIVRTLAIPDPEVSSFWSGKEDEPSIVKPFASFAQESDAAPSPVPATQKVAPVPLAAPKPAAPQALQPAAPASQATAPVATPPSSASPPAASSAQQAASAVQSATQGDQTSTTGAQSAPQTVSPSAQPGVTPAVTAPIPVLPVPNQPVQATPQAAPIAPASTPEQVPQPVNRGSLNITAPSSAGLGTQFRVEVKASDVKNLAKAPFVLLFDPIFLDYVGITEGNLLNRDGKPTNFSAFADKRSGRVVVSMERAGNIPGIDGSGTLINATFTAKNKGPASLGLQDVNFADPTGKPLVIVPYNTVVEVR